MRWRSNAAIITGGKQGIGRGIANLLAARGAKIVLVNRQDAAKEAAEIGKDAIAIAADVTSKADWARVAAEVEQTFGSADILVHAAGIYLCLDQQADVPSPLTACFPGEPEQLDGIYPQ